MSQTSLVLEVARRDFDSELTSRPKLEDRARRAEEGLATLQRHFDYTSEANRVREDRLRVAFQHTEAAEQARKAAVASVSISGGSPAMTTP